MNDFRPLHKTQIPFAMPCLSTNTYLPATAILNWHPAGSDKGKANAISNILRLILCIKNPEICQFVYCPYTIFFVLVSSVAAVPSVHIIPVPFLIIFPGPWAAAQFQLSILREIIFWHGSVILFDFNFIVNVETAQQP